MLKGGNWHVFQFWKHFNNAFFLDTVEASSFKLHDYYFAWGLHFHGRFGDLCFEVTDVSEISAWNCAFQILVLVLVYCSLCVVWLLHTLRRSCTVWIVQLWCVFKGDNLHVFGRWLVENWNIGIFPDTINVIKVKLCMMVPHIDLYLFITLSVTLTLFEDHSSVKQF